MSYIPKDCRKCTRIIKNNDGFFCTALGRYINNYQILGEYITEENSNVIINTPESDQYDEKCDFNPSDDYDIEDYYEPLNEMDAMSRGYKKKIRELEKENEKLKEELRKLTT